MQFFFDFFQEKNLKVDSRSNLIFCGETGQKRRFRHFLDMPLGRQGFEFVRGGG